MKHIFLITILWTYCIYVSGQTGAEDIVYNFGNNLKTWCTTQNVIYRSKAQAQCTSACRVKDKIIEDYAIRKGLDIKNYVISSYLNCFEAAMTKGTINIVFSNVKTVSKNNTVVSSYSGSHTGAEKQMSEFEFISSEINVSGVLNYNIKNLYYISNGKIVKITPYEEVTDRKTGEKKVKIDLSDMINDFFYDITDGDYNALGFYLGYSKSFPINFGVHYNWSLLNIGIELGYNWDKDALYIRDDGNNKETIKKKGLSCLVTPGIFLQYLTLNFGVGFANFERDRDFNYSINGTDTGINVETNIKDEKMYFLMKPSLEFNIPVAMSKWEDPSFFLCPRIAYLHAPNLKKINGWEFGLCFRYIIAD